MTQAGLTRRDLFRFFTGGKRGQKGVLKPPNMEEGFFQTLYDCEGCAKAAEARAGQKEQCSTQCPIHGL